MRRAVGAGAGATALAATGRFAVVGTEGQPTREVFFRGPAGHVQTDLTKDRQSRVGVDAIDPREIDARLVFEQRLGVERDAAFAVRLLACGRQVMIGRRSGAVGERLQVLFDPRVVLRDQTLHRPVQLARLLQREEVLNPPAQSETEASTIYEERVVKSWMQKIGFTRLVEILLAVGIGRCVPSPGRALCGSGG